MSELSNHVAWGTIITSPALDVVNADVEFHVANGRVVFVIVKCRETVDARVASAIGQVLRVEDNE